MTAVSFFLVTRDQYWDVSDVSFDVTDAAVAFPSHTSSLCGVS